VYGGLVAGSGERQVAEKPLPASPITAPGALNFTVQGTCRNSRCGLPKLNGPSTSDYQLNALLPDGYVVGVVCQTAGELVTAADGFGSNVWDKLTDGDYVADLYVDTPGASGHFTPAIPRCAHPPPAPSEGAPPFYLHRVVVICAHDSCPVRARAGPGNTFQVSGELHDDDEVHVVCQVKGRDSVGDSSTFYTSVWDRLDDGRWVSDYYLDTTGGPGGFTAPIPQCSSGARPAVAPHSAEGPGQIRRSDRLW
jgi:hypothetical protein